LFRDFIVSLAAFYRQFDIFIALVEGLRI